MFNILKTKPTNPDRPRFTVIQAARHMGVTRDYVYKLIKQKKLRSHNYLGRMCLYVEECILKRPTKTDGTIILRRTPQQIKEAKRKAKEKIKNRLLYLKKKQAIKDNMTDEEKKARRIKKTRATKKKKAAFRRAKYRNDS